MKRTLCLLLCASIPLMSQMKEIDVFPAGHDQSRSRLRILDAKELSYASLEGVEFTEISALAYDKKEGLFALSDRGGLFRLELEIKNKKIKTLNLQKAYLLKSKKAKPLKRKRRDSEGMVFTDEGLLVSFELTPKVSLFDLQGRKIRNLELPKVLKDIGNYRSKNKALESLVNHPDYGLITSPESALKHEKEEYHTLYSSSKRWKFPASGEVTALELLEDKNILVLERDFSMLSGHKISLKKVSIMDCKTEVCPSETLAFLESTQGWNIDNFEGLTHIRDNLYLMISDDNGTFFQKCILVLFEIDPR